MVKHFQIIKLWCKIYLFIFHYNLLYLIWWHFKCKSSRIEESKKLGHYLVKILVIIFCYFFYMKVKLIFYSRIQPNSIISTTNKALSSYFFYLSCLTRSYIRSSISLPEINKCEDSNGRNEPIGGQFKIKMKGRIEGDKGNVTLYLTCRLQALMVFRIKRVIYTCIQVVRIKIL